MHLVFFSKETSPSQLRMQVFTKVYRNSFWMMHFGSKSTKRTTVWSIRKLLVGILEHWFPGSPFGAEDPRSQLQKNLRTQGKKLPKELQKMMTPPAPGPHLAFTNSLLCFHQPTSWLFTYRPNSSTSWKGSGPTFNDRNPYHGYINHYKPL